MRNNLRIYPGKLVVFCLAAVVAAGALGAAAQPSGNPITLTALTVDDRTDHVNVMGDEMPVIPAFPPLAKKPGYLRGYVKDIFGEPLAGAQIGLKSARLYDAYLAAAAETDAAGYYEIKIPAGGARFDYAGFVIPYSRGQAALGLHPADGALSESYTAAAGGVENFVMLSYGVADREEARRNGRYRGNYYGGTLTLRYFIAPPGESGGAFGNMLAAGSEIVVTLKPVSIIADGRPVARAFEIRKKIEESSLGEFYLCNVPVGRYELTVRTADGRALSLKQKKPTDSPFGIQPAETSGTASLIFNPLSADAKTAVAGRGNWTDLEIVVERP
jgi:hypothetical protein